MNQHIAVYIRVSSKQQDQRSQVAELESWVQAYAGDTTVKYYRDSASGTSMDRKGWNRLQANINKGQVSKLVCWRIDRLGRTASGLTQLFDELNAKQIGLVSIKDALDLSTPAGRLMANVLASVAAYETELRSERQMAGIAAAKAQGKRWGGSKKGRLLSVTDEQVSLVIDMHKEGTAKTAISRSTGVSRPTVYRLIERYEAGALATSSVDR